VPLPVIPKNAERLEAASIWPNAPSVGPV
jgi:hypothetical protein